MSKAKTNLNRRARKLADAIKKSGLGEDLLDLSALCEAEARTFRPTRVVLASLLLNLMNDELTSALARARFLSGPPPWSKNPLTEFRWIVIDDPQGENTK